MRKSKKEILSGKSALKDALILAVAVYISSCSECWCMFATICFLRYLELLLTSYKNQGFGEK